MEEKISDTGLGEILRKADIFASLGAVELEFIASNSSLMHAGADEIVFEAGSPGDALFIVVSGSVGIESASPDEGERRIAELIAGDCFGELDLLTNSPRMARAKAVEASRLLRFPAFGKKIDTLMQSRPDTAAKLLRSMLAVVSGRIRKANALIKENSPLVQELRRQVYGDKLSGLSNKTWLVETLPSLCGDRGRLFALLMFKPDNFKAINDRYGHEAGDRTIILMAAELKRIAAEGESPFRFAGNELGLVLPALGRAEARERSGAVLDLLRELDLKAALQDQAGEEAPPKLSISAGIALYPEHGEGAEALIAAVNELPLTGRARGGNLILFPEDL